MVLAVARGGWARIANMLAHVCNPRGGCLHHARHSIKILVSCMLNQPYSVQLSFLALLWARAFRLCRRKRGASSCSACPLLSPYFLRPIVLERHTNGTAVPEGALVQSVRLRYRCPRGAWAGGLPQSSALAIGPYSGLSVPHYRLSAVVACPSSGSETIAIVVVLNRDCLHYRGRHDFTVA